MEYLESYSPKLFHPSSMHQCPHKRHQPVQGPKTRPFSTKVRCCEAVGYVTTFRLYACITELSTASQSSYRPIASKDTVIQSEVNKILDDLRPAMTRLVEGEICLPVWTPDSSTMGVEMANHIGDLRIPYLNGKPNVLLHHLGSFKEDPALATRLKNIFMPNNHTCVNSNLASSPIF